MLSHLAEAPHEMPALALGTEDVMGDDDAMLTLHVLYELHYRGFAGVDERWEWEPSVLRERAGLEAVFERSLVDRIGPPPAFATAATVHEELIRLASQDGRSLSRHMEDKGTLAQMREFAVHRSAYQLKEADPHAWAIPRLTGRAKAALVEIEYGEYGEGNPAVDHATLFAGTMHALDLDDTYGAYLDLLPAATLATGNLISLLGLHRRWRAALVGHLALFEMCSVVPMARYAAAMRRLGRDDGARFYDVHVAADRHHEVIACREMAGGLAVDEPARARDIIFGARALDHVESRFAASLLDAWAAGHTSLLEPLSCPR